MARRTLPHGLSIVLLLAAGTAVPAAAQDTAVSSALVHGHDTLPGSAAGQPSSDAGPFFYRGLPYGSDATYGPLAVLLNKGFAVSLMEGTTRKLSDFPYGLESVTDALAHPLAAIERSGGWGTFVRQELLPLAYTNHGYQWYPNYTGHLIEGGIHWRRLKEWYEAHGVPLPGLMSGITTMSAAFLNEIYETDGAETGYSGTVADLYFFDLAGIVLFSFDGVSRFFARTLHANVWTSQASLVFPAAEVDNNASHLYFKIPWKVIPSSSVFFWTGIGGGLGLTLHRGDGLDVSFGAGTDARSRHIDPETGEETARLGIGAGLYLDRNGSLLLSAHVSEIQHRLLRVNVYPGLLGGVGQNLGAWVIVSHDWDVRVGIISRYSLGAGLGVGQ